tara:strand:+ start:254 stop:571 length:318 start_codon:yes stop_codon:yes gene_type:complete
MKDNKIIEKLNRAILCLMVHPDNEPNSEFQDVLSDLTEVVLLVNALSKPSTPVVVERYPKNCILQYKEGWYITFKIKSGSIHKSRGPYPTKSMAEHDRQSINARY